MTPTNGSTDPHIASLPEHTQRGTPQQELILTRIIDAPRELVFDAWTDPKQMARWWGPKYFTNPLCELDARPGGAILIHMADPDGVIYPMKGVFHEIVRPERLVFSSMAFEDETGKPGLEAFHTVTFAEHAGKTKFTLHTIVVRAEPGTEGALAGMEEGWSQSLDKLAALRFVTTND